MSFDPSRQECAVTAIEAVDATAWSTTYKITVKLYGNQVISFECASYDLPRETAVGVTATIHHVPGVGWRIANPRSLLGTFFDWLTRAKPRTQGA